MKAKATPATQQSDCPKLEQRLKEMEGLKALLDRSLDTFFLFDPKTEKALLWNQTFREITGYSDEEIARIPAPMSYYSPEDLARAEAFIAQVLEEGTGTIELELICKDGRKIPTEYRVSVIENSQGEPESILSIGRDVTERKRVKEALQQSEERYRTLFEQANDAIFLENENDEILDVNRRACEMLGYTREELLAMKVTDLQAPEVRGQEGSVIKHEIERHAGVPFESVDLHHDGTRIPVEVSTARLTGLEAGNVLSIVRDISERKQAEEALLESRQFLQDVFDAIQDGISILDTELNVIRTNRWMEDMYGDQGPLAGKRCYQIYQRRRSPCPWCPSILTIETGEVHTAVVPYPSEDDPKGWIELFTFPIKDAEGRVTSVIEYVKDITARKQAELERVRLTEELRGQARRVEQILSTVPEGVLLLGAKGKFLQANPTAEEYIAALTEAEAGDTITHLGNRRLAELLTSPPTRGLWHEVKAGGRTFEVIARAMENGQQPEDWLLVIRDVTREREIERRTHQQEQLAVVGQLAAGIAHDFNNIMAIILLYTQMGLIRPDLPSKHRENLQVIVQQARRATDLIQQVLDFSRRAVLERRPLDLVPFLVETVGLLERTMPEDIRLELSAGSEEYAVSADPTRLQQAVMNLAINARDAMPQGGQLRFKVGKLQVQHRRESPLPEMDAGEWVCVAVTDTGCGIAPDVLPHIYEPFFTTKEAAKGAGLGLSQVYGIIKQHDGHIDVTTKVGEGTTFSIYLPALQVKEPEKLHSETQLFVQGQGETILLVEDDAVLRQALVNSIELLNYRVVEAANGIEALDILEQAAGEVALVLSDLVMPEMGGQALFHAMKERGLATPILMLTGHPMESELKSLQEQGLDGWMLKPPKMDKLSQILARLLRSAIEG